MYYVSVCLLLFVSMRVCVFLHLSIHWLLWMYGCLCVSEEYRIYLQHICKLKCVCFYMCELNLCKHVQLSTDLLKDLSLIENLNLEGYEYGADKIKALLSYCTLKHP